MEECCNKLGESRQQAIATPPHPLGTKLIATTAEASGLLSKVVLFLLPRLRTVGRSKAKVSR